MTVILFLLLSFSAFAQGQFEYRLEGSFDGGPGDSVVINYTISWNETSPTIQGVYQDNYFSQNIPKVVSGTRSDEGRRFTVILPVEVSGVSALRFFTSSENAMSGSIPMEVQTSGEIGNVVNTDTGFALMNSLPSALVDPYTNEDVCTVGFGALTGYCGLYSGNFNEFSDPANRCNILSGGNTRLELGTDTIFRLYLNYIPGVVNNPIHIIGAFLPTPLTNSINVSSTNCGPLPGTSFLPNCKDLNLSGSFSLQGANIVFTGTYTIRDQVTGESCSHSMILNRSGIGY